MCKFDVALLVWRKPSPDLIENLDRAYALAVRNGDDEFSLEHLMAAFTKDASAAEYLARNGIALALIVERAERLFDKKLSELFKATNAVTAGSRQQVVGEILEAMEGRQRSAGHQPYDNIRDVPIGDLIDNIGRIFSKQNGPGAPPLGGGLGASASGSPMDQVRRAAVDAVLADQVAPTPNEDLRRALARACQNAANAGKEVEVSSEWVIRTLAADNDTSAGAFLREHLFKNKKQDQYTPLEPGKEYKSKSTYEAWVAEASDDKRDEQKGKPSAVLNQAVWLSDRIVSQLRGKLREENRSYRLLCDLEGDNSSNAVQIKRKYEADLKDNQHYKALQYMVQAKRTFELDCRHLQSVLWPLVSVNGKPTALDNAIKGMVVQPQPAAASSTVGQAAGGGGPKPPSPTADPTAGGPTAGGNGSISPDGNTIRARQPLYSPPPVQAEAAASGLFGWLRRFFSGAREERGAEHQAASRTAPPERSATPGHGALRSSSFQVRHEGGTKSYLDSSKVQPHANGSSALHSFFLAFVLFLALGAALATIFVNRTAIASFLSGFIHPRIEVAQNRSNLVRQQAPLNGVGNELHHTRAERAEGERGGAGSRGQQSRRDAAEPRP
ncbi:MAG: hypothetical protein RLZ98_90 [Pseudomonadota bacterium]|jgi:hypothetical protein